MGARWLNTGKGLAVVKKIHDLSSCTDDSNFRHVGITEWSLTCPHPYEAIFCKTIPKSFWVYWELSRHSSVSEPAPQGKIVHCTQGTLKAVSPLQFLARKRAESSVYTVSDKWTISRYVTSLKCCISTCDEMLLCFEYLIHIFMTICDREDRAVQNKICS